MVNGMPCSFADAFKPRSSTHTKLLTGLWLPSISRGVCYPDYLDIHYVALTNVMRARSLLDCRLPDAAKLRAALVGKSYSAITPSNLPKPSWQPTQMEVLHRLIQHMHDSRKGPSSSLKCHFGHIAQSSLKQDLFPNWRGAPKGAVLCQPCHAQLQADIRRCPSVAPAPQKKRRLGPCALGHTTSSFNRNWP